MTTTIKQVDLREPHFAGFSCCLLPVSREFGVRLEDGEHSDSERVPVKWDGLPRRQAVQQMLDAMLHAANAGVSAEDIQQAAAAVVRLVQRNAYTLVPGAKTVGLMVLSPACVQYVVELGEERYLAVSPGIESRQVSGDDLRLQYVQIHDC